MCQIISRVLINNSYKKRHYNNVTRIFHSDGVHYDFLGYSTGVKNDSVLMCLVSWGDITTRHLWIYGSRLSLIFHEIYR